MKKIVIFASGKGSNCISIFKKVVQIEKTAKLHKIISDNEKAGILIWAKENKIDFEVINPKKFDDSHKFGEALKHSLGQNIDLIILAGYLKKIPNCFIDDFPNKIINIHPALLPSFGGKGMYGMNVHKKVFEIGTKLSGITIHLIDNKYDNGPIIFQEAVNIEDCKTPEEIASKVLQIEHKCYGEIINKLLKKSYIVHNGRFDWKENG